MYKNHEPDNSKANKVESKISSCKHILSMKEKYIIVSPCFNEEKIIEAFLHSVENILAHSGIYFTIIMVDDASTDSTLEKLKEFKFSSDLLELKVIRSSINSGHQEAIRLGLKYAWKYLSDVKGVIVMDSDGEDDPAAILELLKLPLFDVVFVARSKRKEGLIFLISYFLYRVLFKIFTGHSISYGNYSLISPEVLNGIHKQKFLHYSAFLSKQKYDIRKIVFPRKKRIDGVSKMNYNGLVLHGLKSMIEFSDEFLIFFIKIFFVALFGVFILSGYILYQKFVSNEAILGWASTLGIGLVNACLIIFGTIIISLLLLSLKNTLKQNDNEYIVIK